MGKTLVITEKPSQARALVKGLHQQFIYVKSNNRKNKTGIPNFYYESDKVLIIPAEGHLFTYWDIPDYLVEDGIIEKSDDGKYNWRDFKEQIPYIPARFKYKEKSGFYGAQYDLIKELIHRNDVDIIYNFADPDAEGELLLREILIQAGNKKDVKRIECKSLAPDAVADAFYNPVSSSNYNHLYLEALARQQTDWLIGINYTTMFTLKCGAFMRLGRVIFPIVKYVYDSDKANSEFVPTVTYGINFNFYSENNKFTITSSKPEIVFSKDEKEKCQKLAEKLNNSHPVITKVEKKKKHLTPKKLYSTSKLYADMSTKYNLRMEETAKICQKLYDNGRIMYPRTDCEYLQTAEIDNTRKTIQKLVAAGYPVQFHTKKSVFNDEKCGTKGEGGHTAIIITDKIFSNEEFKDLNIKEQAVYMAIFNRTIANFCAEPDIDETTLTIACDEYEFKIKGDVVNKKGFLEFDERKLPAEIKGFAEGEVLQDFKFEVAERKTKAPPKATETRLLYYLKNPLEKVPDDLVEGFEQTDEQYDNLKKGITIGTEATTKDAILKTITTGYIDRKKSVYSITNKGKALVELFEKLNFHNLDASRTIELNQIIKKIGIGMTTLESNKNKIKRELNETKGVLLTSNIVIKVDDYKKKTEPIGKCPKCGSPVIETEHTFKCSSDKCKFYMYKENNFFAKALGGKKITKTMAKGFLSNKHIAKVTGIKSKNKTDENGKPLKYDALIKVDFSGQYPEFSFGGFPEKKARKTKKKE